MDRPRTNGDYVATVLPTRCGTTWGRLRLQFGMEAYCVPEGERRVLEELRNQQPLSAEVALAPWGQAALCELK